MKLAGAALVALLAAAGAPRGDEPALAPAPSSSGTFANLTGFSGKLRAIFLEPEDAARLKTAGAVLADPGVYSLTAAKGLSGGLALFVLTPFSEKIAGRIDGYEMGVWPEEQGVKTPGAAYANPRGFVKLAKDAARVPVSEHFSAGDFITKNQLDVWPKYLVLDPRLLDKLELTIAQLNAMGYPVKGLHVMSGFRTPRYNDLDLGPKARSAVSRHMYGDAADVYPDDDHDDRIDDLNHDGRVDVEDARIVFRAAEEVEKRFPALIGGVAIYPATSAHGPFVHIDCRGKRARWGVGFGE